MRLKLSMKLSPRAKYSAYCLLAVVAAIGLLAIGAQLGPQATAQASTTAEAAPPPPAHKQAQSEPEPVRVPHSASGARSGGMGGQSWMTGDTSRLGSDFKRAVVNQFGEGTLGQAHMAMSGLGFQCTSTGGRMECEKSMRADNCTLTWSVKLQSTGGDVRGAGGEGFSRECS
jgi:hypothetical protein